MVNNQQEKLKGRKLLYFFVVIACLLFTVNTANATAKFDRIYNPKGNAHLTISNVNGSITVAAWSKKSVMVSAINEPSAIIEDQMIGDTIKLSVKKAQRPGKVDFLIYVPAETALALNNYMGRIEVRGVHGDINIKSYDSEVHLVDVHIPSADVNVTTGDIFFDGDLTGTGPYSFQTLRGDLNVTLPAKTPFQLSTRALSENINLGDFLNSLTATNKAPKEISGTHLKGGPQLKLITFAGRILLHKK
jgi:hypothetical protein